MGLALHVLPPMDRAIPLAVVTVAAACVIDDAIIRIFLTRYHAVMIRRDKKRLTAYHKANSTETAYTLKPTPGNNVA